LCNPQQWWQRWYCAYIRMAEEDNKLLIPRDEEEEDDIVTPVDPAVWDW